MASNDYYRSNNAHASPYHDAPYDRTYGGDSLSRTTTNPSYTDYSHPYSQKSVHAQPYLGGSGRMHDDPDPYDDNNAIPLNGRRKHDSTTSVTPMIKNLPPDDDPFVRDIQPQRKRRRESRGGWFKGKITWVVYVLTTAQLIVFIAELVKNGVLTSTPIQIKPSFNPMIGPSPYVLINMGARYVPCMHYMASIQDSAVPIAWPCPNATAVSGPSVSCSLSDLCGNGGVPDQAAPNQWWRFIVPIFLHAGIIHIGFNLLLQMTLGRDVEKLIGSIRFTIVYFAAGIFGFVLGGNFAANGIASTGCSGSLFGIMAITLVDLLYCWKERESPVKDLCFILIDVIIAFVLGLLPGLDNFSHIGGFFMGLVLGICILRSPTAFSQRTSHDYVIPAQSGDRDGGIVSFVRQPVSFFRNRRPIWWVWWFVRAAALIFTLICFILLLKNFYQWGATCGWCKYLSCLPIKMGETDWCSVGNLNFTPNNGTSAKRDIFDFAARAAFRPAAFL